MTILCYHAVQPHWSSPLAVEPHIFERHVAWLARRRDVVTLTEAVARLDSRGRLPRGVVALTFDDGFSSVMEHALPVLVEHGLPATVFLVAETLTAEGRAVDWVDTPPPYPLTTLTRGDVSAMQSMGVSFGSHTYAHGDLTAMSFDDCVRDLRTSRELLEDLLREPVPYLAYPRGRNDARVREASRLAGYSHAFSLPQESEATDNRHGVPRVGVWPYDGALSLRAKTTPAYLSFRMNPVFPAARRVARKTGLLTG